MILKVKVYKKDTEETVIDGEAEIEQENTAYAFTGQGSQEQGMGMALYNSSPVARRVWDEADQILKDLYGWSILDIVRNNPKRLTVRFGGKRGRQIRENYLKLSVETTLADGRIVTEPLLKALDHQSTSYTFVDAQGLLYSTQFAQPAITILEKASFEDMRSKGLVQESASFAGHSLGEYGALSSVADFIPFKALMGICLYRGLAMQGAMERDEQGRTEYSMVAVSPARVGKFFDEAALRQVTEIIMQKSQLLLEIVNFNIEGQQYVCAGHLRALATLTSLLNHLSTLHPPTLTTLFHPPSSPSLHALITTFLPPPTTTNTPPIPLTRGIATIPLQGIDVPFHSTHLRPSVPSYRSFLQRHVDMEGLQIEKLEGRWVANVVGRAFRVERGFVREAWRVTGSEILRELLESGGWDERDEGEGGEASE